eukprot:1129635-Alexandrium_andersonii.AAC.1
MSASAANQRQVPSCHPTFHSLRTAGALASARASRAGGLWGSGAEGWARGRDSGELCSRAGMGAGRGARGPKRSAWPFAGCGPLRAALAKAI